jgi:hypothetical protein
MLNSYCFLLCLWIRGPSCNQGHHDCCCRFTVLGGGLLVLAYTILGIGKTPDVNTVGRFGSKRSLQEFQEAHNVVTAVGQSRVSTETCVTGMFISCKCSSDAVRLHAAAVHTLLVGNKRECRSTDMHLVLGYGVSTMHAPHWYTPLGRVFQRGYMRNRAYLWCL